MNIVVVSLRGPTNSAKRGGAQDYIRFILKNFDLTMHQITIICGSERYAGELLPYREVVDGLSIVRCELKVTRIGPILKELSQHVHSADVVIENIMGFPFMLPLYFRLKRWNIPLIAIKHHFEGRNFLHSQGLIKGLIGIFLEEIVQPLIYAKVNFVGVSDITANRIKEAWYKPEYAVHKIPPGIEVEYPKLPTHKSIYPLILYFGAIDTGRKRVDHLIDAFSLLLIKFPDAQLVIGGAGPDLNKMIEKAKGLNINFTGFISEAEKQQLLKKAWFFASPSNSEGFGITWVEANAYGLPVIGYDLGLDTVNIECAIMVKQNDIIALSDAMIELIENNEKRNLMSLASQKNARRFDWQVSSKSFETLIEQVVHY